MDKIQIVSLQMVKEKKLECEYGGKVSSPNAVADIFKKYIGNMDREYLACICVDTKNKVTSLEKISVGSLNSSIVTPREVFKLAILSNSASIIVAHNHPSYNLSPSQEDINITRRLKESGKILGIELLDHLIVSEDNYFSFKEKGLLD